MTLWWLTRSTALVSFVLLTATTVLGVVTTSRLLVTARWPRFANASLHRNLSLLGLTLMTAHIVTAIADRFVHISWWAVVVPFASGYHRLGVALGTLSLDLLLAVIATSLLRGRIVSARIWRGIHWAAYAVYPMALLHFVRTGTDAAHGRWGVWLALTSMLAVAAAVVARVVTPGTPRRLASAAVVSR